MKFKHLERALREAEAIVEHEEEDTQRYRLAVALLAIRDNPQLVLPANKFIGPKPELLHLGIPQR